MFETTRLKLTAWYLLIIMAVSTAFSAVIYRAITGEIERFERIQRLRIERRLQPRAPFPLPMNPELLEETKQRVLFTLILVNTGILLISGGLGYFLAGRTLSPIKDMLDEQNRFISDSSHELRTPLTSLKSALEVGLRDKKLGLTQAKNLMAESIGDVNKLVSLTNSLLALSQYQKPNGSTPFKKVSLQGVIRDAVKKIEPLAKKKHIIVTADVSDISILGDTFSLVDLVVILLDNAVKYSPNGKNVIVKARGSNGSVTISVHDNGIGIAAKDLPHVFDRFYRTDSARTRTKSGGYGLGLAIANKIVDLHHGTIKVESLLHKGSIVTVRLPVGFS